MTTEAIKKRLDKAESSIPGKHLNLELTDQYAARIGSMFDEAHGPWMTRDELITLLDRGEYQTVGAVCVNPFRWYYDTWNRRDWYTPVNEVGSTVSMLMPTTLLDDARAYGE